MPDRNIPSKSIVPQLIKTGAFLLLTGVLMFISMYLTGQGPSGEFTKFFMREVVMENFFGLFLILVGLIIIGIVMYFVLTGRAHKPLKAVLFSVPLTLFFVGLGLALAWNLRDDVADAVYFYHGHYEEEVVVIAEYDRIKRGHRFILEDGREFTEYYHGAGYRNVIPGNPYLIQYLPHTHKILRIERTVSTE
ncbi:hypothetical protein JCM10914A_45550 [Paenibacillus sp. JCM 10914]|uniref:hypothetical protein n=1 Tax=Paenibacillus sp. JCM 10914 TaxID=1236974 RepID=UPI0003CC9F1D|nr:hypothetical protein [Paenibacillus sp. JCM 10914]GAE09780.1 hypothetical protein JCM10914_6167 [Paenibacillus sp. JCM 10914]